MLHEESRPQWAAPTVPTAIEYQASLGDLDALAEHLRGRFVVQVEVDGDKYRTHIYRSTAAAERAVRRANAVGKRAHVTLVQLLPVGVVVNLGGGRRG